MESNPAYPELSESLRFPILSSRGRSLLHRMRQHPNAPIWNWPNGEQLDDLGLERVNQFAQALDNQSAYYDLSHPEWLSDHTLRCINEVPYFRNRYHLSWDWSEIPTTCRAALAPRVWEFVPDSESLEQVIVFSSSGTTGYPTRTAHHPYSAACGVPIMEYALRELHGIEFLRGPDHVAITNVAAYRGAFTTAIVVAYLQESGCIRVNLDSSAWRSPDDCRQFINAWKAPIWLGDPIAYSSMEKLDLDHGPAAILSSIMHLNESYAQVLQQRYACPILDMYAMTEAGIIAVNTDFGYRILPHDLYVEILDEDGNACPVGMRGEITLTGGRNPFLPLLRYRTGDHASLSVLNGHRYLTQFEGRQPITYATLDGRRIHSMEITRIMRRYPVVRYAMQSRPGDQFALQIHGDVDRMALAQELAELFGQHVPIEQLSGGS